VLRKIEEDGWNVARINSYVDSIPAAEQVVVPGKRGRKKAVGGKQRTIPQVLEVCTNAIKGDHADVKIPLGEVMAQMLKFIKKGKGLDPVTMFDELGAKYGKKKPATAAA
jgi:hypothetical protein